MTTFKWRVWFLGQAEPVLVETDVQLTVHAIGKAIDQTNRNKNAGLNVARVELLDVNGAIANEWTWKPATVQARKIIAHP